MTITLSAKGQIVIPAPIRKRYKLKQNSKIEVIDTGHSIVIRPVSDKDPFLASYGLLKGKITSKESLNLRKEEKDREHKIF